MELYAWRSGYEIGHERVDDQHRELVGMINRMYRAMKEGSGNAAIETILDELLDYAQLHFDTEEKAMRDSAFPGLEAQQQEHIDLTRKVLRLRHKWQQDRSVKTIELLDFLRQWFIDHISKEDLEFGRYLKTQNLS